MKGLSIPPARNLIICVCVKSQGLRDASARLPGYFFLFKAETNYNSDKKRWFDLFVCVV